MKLHTIFFILLTSIIGFLKLSAQETSGIVHYKTVIIDTLQNTIIPQDSIYTQFSFKPNKAKWETGFLNHVMNIKTIQNELDFYSMFNDPNSKKALHGRMPDTNSYDELLNYQDTALLVIKSEATKNVAGYLCKKITLKFSEDDPGMTLWYDETITCNSLIPNAGINNQHIRGLVLEYEIPNASGKSIITADLVVFEDIPEIEFNPNLEGYEVTEIE